MIIKRKFRKVVAAGFVSMTFILTGISAFASIDVSVTSVRSYNRSYSGDKNSTCICSTGKSTLKADTIYFKEAYYEAYGYNVGVGYYSIYDTSRSKKTTSNPCETSYVSLTSEAKRATHRFVLRSGTSSSSKKVYDIGYIMTQN